MKAHRSEKVRRTHRWLIVALLAMTAFIAAPSFASADSGTGTPSVWTDQPSYAPGDVASISGSGFAAGDTVSVSLSDSLTGWTSPTVDETVAADGSFSGAPLALPPTFSSSITATATDAATGDTASAPVMETMLAPTFTPSVTTDQQDYAPGTVVTITGSGWPAGDSVSVFTNDTSGNTWSQTDHVTTDASGDFIDTVTLPNIFISNYTVTASDASGLTATTAFTDGNLTSISGNVTDSSTSGALSGVNVACTSGCNASISTTTDASGKYSFSGGNKLSFSGNGPATLILTFSKSGYASGTITLSNVNNGDSFTNENIALNPSGPTKLAFTTSAFTGTVGQCLGPINVQTQNAGGTAINVTSTTTVNLATDNGSTGAGAFYSDNGCSSSITNRTIATGNNSTSFYYEASGRGSGSHQLTVSATGLTSATQNETVSKANQTITFTSTAPTAAKVGGSYTPSATGGGSGNAVTFGTSGGNCSYDNISGKVNYDHAGSCTVTADQAGNSDYNAASQATQTFTIGKADQTITVATAAPASKVYGDQFTVAATGGGSGNSIAYGSSGGCSNSGATYTMTSGTTNCHVTFDQAGNGDYNAASQVTETVNATTRNVTASFTADNKTYDGNTSATVHSCTLDAQSGDHGVITADIGNVGCSVSNGQFGTASADTGKTVTATAALTGSADGNYQLTSTSPSATADITQAPLTVTADNKSKIYDGNPFTAFTSTITGFVNGENSSVVSGSVTTYNGNAVGATGVGTYTITPVVTGLTATNYTFTAANGTLTISPALLTVTADNKSKIYDGNPFTAFTSTITGFVNGENSSVVSGSVTTYNGNAVGATGVGTYTITPVVTGLTATNYAFTAANGTLTIGAWNAAGKGFYAPIGADTAHTRFTPAPAAAPTTFPSSMVWNTIKGGQTVPLKFNIFAGATEMTGANAFPGSDLTKAFQTQKLNCIDSSSTDPVDYTTTTGQTVLRYDTTGMQWIQNWATPKVSSTTCFRTWVTFADGSTLESFFQLTK